jgi:hypothetical protein
VENDEVKNSDIIHNNTDKNNEHGVDFVERSDLNENQSDGAHKTPIMGKGLWSSEEDQ